jgi:hypothetical protein
MEMKKVPKEPLANEIALTINEFLLSFNKNMPSNYPSVTTAQLLKFKAEHASLFKNGGEWSLDQHRKRMIDWLPQNNS